MAAYPHFAVSLENTRGASEAVVLFASADLAEAERVFDAQPTPPRGKSLRLRDYRDDLGWSFDERSLYDPEDAALLAAANEDQERESSDYGVSISQAGAP